MNMNDLPAGITHSDAQYFLAGVLGALDVGTTIALLAGVIAESNTTEPEAARDLSQELNILAHSDAVVALDAA